jgi:hypothetical protein
LIASGVVVVAIIGSLVVRYSSASTWFSIYRSDYRSTIRVVSTTMTASRDLVAGKSYRFCVRGYSNGPSTTLRLSFNKENQPYRAGVASSTKRYGTASVLHCSATFRTTTSYRVSGNAEHVAGSSLTNQVMSIDELR